MAAINFQHLTVQDEGVMSVTMVIVNWDSGSLLNECLRHLEQQTTPPSQVIVIGNGPDEGMIDKVVCVSP